MSVKKAQLLLLLIFCQIAAAQKPNVIVILADDVGYGDLECHGNELVQTPALNQLRKESTRFERFLVSPTCSPTRAALMTGRWPFEVGVNHTIAGRSILRAGVPTVADAFQSAGYRTGIFGKWHLGESYPSRPTDRGFDEVFIHQGGGIGQTPDYWGNSYFSPHIFHNGEWQKQNGFCTDIFIDEFLKWSELSRDPYFAYIPLNAAHAPWTVKEEWTEALIKRGVEGKLASFYALIEQMDGQIAKLLDKIDRQNTIVIFLSDNGTAGSGFNAEMKGRKGSADEGGVRVPFFISYPDKIPADRSTEHIAGHIDLFPTLCGLAGVPVPEGAELDGADWSKWLLGNAEPVTGRLWFTNVGRWNGREDPSMARMRNFAVRDDQFRLVAPEMFDMKADPAQKTDVMDEQLAVAAPMLSAYRVWWNLQRKQIFTPVRIVLGNEADPIVHLTGHDWYPSPTAPESIGAEAIWDQSQVRDYYQELWELRAGRKAEDDLPEIRGVWKVDVARKGQYKITLRKLPEEALESKDKKLANIQEGTANLIVGKSTAVAKLRGMVNKIEILLDLEAGPQDMEAWFAGLFPRDKAKGLGAIYVTAERIGERSFEK